MRVRTDPGDQGTEKQDRERRGPEVFVGVVGFCKAEITGSKGKTCAQDD